MLLREQEKTRALEIRAAVRRDPQLKPLSDFMCAQFAIVSLMEDNELKVVIDKIYQLQHLKEEYEILDNEEDGAEAVSRLVQDVNPGNHLAYGYCHLEKAYFHVCNLTRFDSMILNDPKKYSSWMAGEYYVNQAQYPDLEAIRRGLVMMVECQ